MKKAGLAPGLEVQANHAEIGSTVATAEGGRHRNAVEQLLATQRLQFARAEHPDPGVIPDDPRSDAPVRAGSGLPPERTASGHASGATSASTSASTTPGSPQPGSARSRLAFQDSLRQLMRCFDVIEEARYPVIAAIQGGCIGGALDLAAACCLRVASADAFFTVQEIHIGMAADLGVLQRLPKIVPPAVAREMAYTGERLGAERALAVGLVNAVRPDAAAALAQAMQWAESIAAKSPLAVAGSKLAINYAVDHPTADALQQMALLQSAIFDIDEMARAIQAWKSRTPAAFDALAPVSAV
jgi:enoyl-CoA hydratase